MIGIVPKRAEHSACHQIRAGLVHAASRHAEVFGLEHHGNAFRIQDFLNRVGDLGRHLFLNLEALGVSIDNPRELRDADDAAARNIGDPGAADDRRHVMFAVALETDAAQHDHLVIAFDLLEGLLQDRLGVLVVAAEILFERARHAGRRFLQAIARRVVAGPADDRLERFLDFAARRLLL